MKRRSRSISKWVACLALVGYLLAGSVLVPFHTHHDGLSAAGLPGRQAGQPLHRTAPPNRSVPSWHDRGTHSTSPRPVAPADCLFCRLLMEGARPELHSPVLPPAELVQWTIAFVPVCASPPVIRCHPPRGPPA